MNEDLPERQPTREEIDGSLVAYRQTRVFRGQLPPPDALRAYEEILPGITSRLLDEVEREANHRRGAELKQLAASESFLSNAASRLREGQRLAFILVLALAVAGCWLAATGSGDVAKFVFGGTMAAIASIFVLGKVLQPSLAEKPPKEEKTSGEAPTHKE